MELDKLIEDHPWSVETIKCKYISYTAAEWVKLVIEYKTRQKLAAHLGCNSATIGSKNKLFKECEGSAIPRTQFLAALGLKKCTDCKVLQTSDNFSKDSTSLDGLQANCKLCASAVVAQWKKDNRGKVNAHSAKYKAAKLQRTPTWSDLEAIAVFYVNCPEGYHVDHIIPLQGEKVSGLHVLENLQYLTARENQSKNNKYEI